MQFALVKGERTAPSPGLAGFCPLCGIVMIPKCGTQKVHHWAHRGERNCDPWWEREKQWHRDWKGKFPRQWREVIQHDRSGERHIADVQTQFGLTIEFQHSHLKPQEREAREKFYGNLLWIVDGSRLDRDLPRFLKGITSFRPIFAKGVYIAPFPEEAFPKTWVNCSVPAFFDFEHAPGNAEASVNIGNPLWCLLPGRVFGNAVVLKYSRAAFINECVDGTHLPFREILATVKRQIEQGRRKQEAAWLRQAATPQRTQWRRYGRFPRSGRF